MTTIDYNKEEYESLRQEIIKRIELRQQIIAISITASGVIMGFGIQNTTLALLFPPLAVFLSLMWAQNDLRALQINDYLAQFENKDNKLGWIAYYKNVQKDGSFKPGLPVSVFAPGGMFVLTSLMSFGIGLSSWNFSKLDLILIDLDIVSILVMIWLVWKISNSRLVRRKKTLFESDH